MTVSGRWGKLAALATLVAIYVAGAGAVMFAPAHGSVASWWPAAGLAVSLIALAPRSWCPLLAVGIVLFSAAANVTGGRDLDVSLVLRHLQRGRGRDRRLPAQEPSGRPAPDWSRSTTSCACSAPRSRAGW